MTQSLICFVYIVVDGFKRSFYIFWNLIGSSYRKTKLSLDNSIGQLVILFFIFLLARQDQSKRKHNVYCFFLFSHVIMFLPFVFRCHVTFFFVIDKDYSSFASIKCLLLCVQLQTYMESKGTLICGVNKQLLVLSNTF